MANRKHLDILKQGVSVWNAWREENPDVRPDLNRAKLKGANLRWADLSEADLTGANLRGTDLRWADLSEANLTEADLTEADLTGANLTEAIVSPVQLCTARTLAHVILAFPAVVDDVCRDCPDKFGPASAYEDGDPRRCGVE